MKLIQKISGTILNSNKNVDIQLDGKNLIIAGGNGSGKTSLALSLFQAIHNHITNGGFQQIQSHIQNLQNLESALKSPNLNNDDRPNIQQHIENSRNALKNLQTPIAIECHLPSETLQLLRQKKATIRFFAADRKANINGVHSATASQPDMQSVDPNSALGQNLEQHLVNLKVRSALAAQAGESGERALHADKWIASFTKNLRYLFEDESTELNFSSDKLRFSITQSGKPEYSFQSLSSGYLAIFDIYADLLMHTEYLQVKPDELSGVVIIDEIDAHLHVSLQRKILPFFTSSFPEIQFIVTTHSPFVLTSVDNAVIFNITTNQAMSDLSMYSYEIVVEGLLGVPPISTKLEETIKELTRVTTPSLFDLKVAEKLLSTITPHVHALDAESEMYYHIANNKIITAKKESM